MTLEENITVIINKLKTMSGKMLSFEKRLKKLEELLAIHVVTFATHHEILQEHTDRIVRLEDGLATVEQKEHEGGFVTEGAWFPNEKFVKWYGEVFNDPIIEAAKLVEHTDEEIAEFEKAPTHADEEVSPETLEKLEEVTKNG